MSRFLENEEKLNEYRKVWRYSIACSNNVSNAFAWSSDWTGDHGRIGGYHSTSQISIPIAKRAI